MSNNKNVETITNTSNILTIMDPIQYRGVLYRFRNWESDRRFAEDIICNHRLYVSTAVDNNDNDPQEINNKIQAQIDDYTKAELYEDDVPSSGLADITESMIFSNQMDDLRRETDRKNIYFCCFSKGYRNEQMWESYGERHKGICVEFNHLHENLKKCLVLPVAYKTDEERNVDPNIQEDLQRLIQEPLRYLYATKRMNFAYEDEVRYIFLDKYDLSLKAGHYYLYFKPECITRIIAGREMSEEAFSQLKNSVRLHLPHAAVIKYGQGEQSFNE